MARASIHVQRAQARRKGDSVSSFSKTILLGRLGKDPELRYTASQKAVCSFSLATSERRGGKDETTWHNIVCWEKTAENVAKHLAKGSQALVEGRIQIREYDGKDGSKQRAFEIVASSVTFVGSKGAAPAAAKEPEAETFDSVPF